MGEMTVEALPLFSRSVGFQCIRVNLPVVAGETEVRRLSLEQSFSSARMPAVAGQTLAFAGGFVDGQNAFTLLPLIVAVQADFRRFVAQHAVIVAGMGGVAGLAVAILDRLVLGRGRNVVMAGQTKPFSRCLDFD